MSRRQRMQKALGKVAVLLRHVPRKAFCATGPGGGVDNSCSPGKGGQGSGNFGHQGRPGEVGGSGEGGVEQVDIRWAFKELDTGGLTPSKSIILDEDAISKNLKSYTNEINEVAKGQKWTSEEINMVTGDFYHPHFEFVNSSLRGVSDIEFDDEMKSYVKKLDKKFKQASMKIPEDTVVYRGLKMGVENFKEGTVYKDKGYFMATKSPLYASVFAASRDTSPAYRTRVFMEMDGEHESDKRVLLRVNIPKNTPALVPPTKEAAPDDLRTARRATNREASYTLNRGTSFLVKKVHAPSEKTGWATMVDLEIQ